jgi:hypothetical protein
MTTPLLWNSGTIFTFALWNLFTIRALCEINYNVKNINDSLQKIINNQSYINTQIKDINKK